MTFLSSIKPDALCVTYFDEAHGSNLASWVLLRLLLYQDVQIRMWYIFMGTKPSLSYYTSRPSESQSLLLLMFSQLIPETVLSLRWKREIRLLPPYVALGFDQHMIANRQTPRTVTMGELQSIKHLSQYGRPL